MITRDRKAISKAPGCLRFSQYGTARPKGVNREKEILEGFTIIQVGEALGHDLWIDKTFIEQVAENASQFETGLKSRFTHPGLSSDGLGTQLGRAKNISLSGNRVIGDLHFIPSAHKTPSGDLSGYVMDLAEEAPEDFGASIVFKKDDSAQEAFVKAHADAKGRFKSPDPANSRNLPHVRLAEMNAVDLVSNPAGAADGLFNANGGELCANAEMALDFLFGHRDTLPEGMFGPLSPERVRGYVEEYLERKSGVFENSDSDSGATRSEQETEGEEIMELSKLTLDQLQAEAPALCETLRKQGQDKGFETGAKETRDTERKRAAGIVREMTGFKGFGTGVHSELCEKAVALLESDKSADEARIDLKIAYFESLQAKAPKEAPGPNIDPDGNEKTQPGREGYFEKVQARAIQFQKENPSWDYDKAMRAASKEIGGMPEA
jgi:hypothetical protein